MPNHVTTFLAAKRDTILAVTREHTAAEKAQHDQEHAERGANYKKRTGNEWPYPLEELPERFVDFNLVIPQPANIERDGCSGNHGPGVVCWYEWNPANWGTKWNAYSNHIEADADGMMLIRFDTAWAHPFPVIAELSRRFPEDTIRVKFADEDLGYNLEAYSIRDGEILTEKNFEFGSPEALDYASMLKHGMSYAQYENQCAEED